MILLDTDVAIDILRNHAPAVAWLQGLGSASTEAWIPQESNATPQDLRQLLKEAAPAEPANQRTTGAVADPLDFCDNASQSKEPESYGT